MDLRIALLGATPERVAAIGREIDALKTAAAVQRAVGGFEELIATITAAESDVILSDIGRIGKTDQMRLESAIASRPELVLILLSSDRSPEFLVWAMRVGISQVVLVPVQRGELQMVLERHLHRRDSGTAAAHGAGRRGRVCAFVPCKGGSGATFLATNAAVALAGRGRRVALLDLNLHFGDAALYLTESADCPTVAELAGDPSRIDADFLESGMKQVRPNLWVLAAPESAEASLEIAPEAIERIVEAARERFDVVVVDCGRVLDGRSLRALDAADAIFMVLQMTLPHVHDAKRIKRMFDDLGYPKDKLRIIVNRFEAGTDINVRDVRRALGCDVELRVPNDFATVAHAINHAIPVFEHKPRAPVSDAVMALADRISPQTARAPRPTGGSLGLRLSSLFATARN